MPKIVRSKNPTALSQLVGGAVALLLAYATIRFLGKFRSGRYFGLVLMFSIFVLIPIIFSSVANTLQVRRYEFDGARRRIVVEDVWFIFKAGRRVEYSFDQIRDVDFTTGSEGFGSVTVVLDSGKKLHCKASDTESVRRFWEQLARVRDGLPPERRAK